MNVFFNTFIHFGYISVPVQWAPLSDTVWHRRDTCMKLWR